VRDGVCGVASGIGWGTYYVADDAQSDQPYGGVDLVYLAYDGVPRPVQALLVGGAHHVWY
jgi:hypothetical protein